MLGAKLGEEKIARIEARTAPFLPITNTCDISEKRQMNIHPKDQEARDSAKESDLGCQQLPEEAVDAGD